MLKCYWQQSQVSSITRLLPTLPLGRSSHKYSCLVPTDIAAIGLISEPGLSNKTQPWRFQDLDLRGTMWSFKISPRSYCRQASASWEKFSIHWLSCIFRASEISACRNFYYLNSKSLFSSFSLNCAVRWPNPEAKAPSGFRSYGKRLILTF